MRNLVRIGVIGDLRPGSEPQTAIGPALGHAADLVGCRVEVEWIATPSLERHADLSRFDGVWCAPGSPYDSLTGALEGIRFARENQQPFIGTCAGFQHGVLEFARNVLGINAEHAEYDASNGSDLIIDELFCSLVGQTMPLRLVDPDVESIYGTADAKEQYYCRFGLNETYVDALGGAGLTVAGIDESNRSTRILRLAGHPFFLLTLFVPQARSVAGCPHPLITAFVAAVANAGVANADR